jgi:hypothetical protein
MTTTPAEIHDVLHTALREYSRSLSLQAGRRTNAGEHLQKYRANLRAEARLAGVLAEIVSRTSHHTVAEFYLNRMP